jgi:hypothetical protein
MKTLMYLVAFLVAFTAFSQQKRSEVTNIKTGKIFFF